MSETQEKVTTKTNREESFVASVIAITRKNKGDAARLRRADNPATEYQSWDILARHGVILDRPHERVPFAAIAAAIGRAEPEANGAQSLGAALARAFDEGAASDAATARLRRLLASDDVVTTCRLLRPVFRIIESRGGAPLDYARILKQVRRLRFDPKRTHSEWAQEFFGTASARGEAQ